MKKISITAIFALLIFTCTNVKAQYIPDSNFAAEIAYYCPSCIDSNHYLTPDAQTLTYLNIGYFNEITDLTGLDGFTNLHTFYVDLGNVSVFPAVPPHLDTLSVAINNLTALPVLPSTMHYLDCSTNSITNLSALPDSLTYLDCSGNNLINLPALPSHLLFFNCGWNWSLISLPTLPSTLTYFICEEDQLINTLPALPASILFLNVSSCAFTSLPDLPDSLIYFYCSDNPLISLPPLSDGLNQFECTHTSLEHLPALPASLRFFDARYGSLLDVPPLPDSLYFVWLSNNSITSLPNLPSAMLNPLIDLSNNPISCLPFIPSNVGYLDISGTNITCLPNIPPNFDNYNNLPLCEEGNLNGCFAYPTIRGNVYGDYNNNGVYDDYEYHANNVIVETNPGNYIGITDSVGNYKIWAPLSSTDTTRVIPFSAYYNAPNVFYTVTFDTSSGQLSLNNDFGILAVSNGSNLDVTLEPEPFRPGFNTNVWVTIRNVGTNDLDGTTELTFDPLLTFISVDQGGTAASNVVTWNFNGLHPFQTETLTATVNCPSNVSIGTILANSASGTVSGASDIDEANNSQTISSTVVGSFDPNDKEVSDVTLTPDELANGKYLEYTIHFQNTGTAPATFINVIDTLSDKLDASTFEMIAASHIYDITLANDLTKANHPVFVKWLFNNIQLPDSSVDFAGSQGFVKFRIKPKNDLLIGDQIQNTAGIYFDFNAPVLTNTAITDVVIANEIANVNDDFFGVSAYPNPAANATRIQFNHVASSQLSFQIADEIGSMVMEKIISVPNELFSINLDLKKFHSGVYVITVKSLNAFHVMKLVKE